MGIVIAVSNKKGGCGKTTTCVQLIDYLANVLEKKVLGIDGDVQGTLSNSYKVKAENGKDLYSFMTNQEGYKTDASAFVEISKNLHFLPSSIQLGNINSMNDIDTPLMLQEALADYKDDFDYIVIDCPPEILTQVSRNIFAAADEVIVPMNPGIYSVEGLALLKSELDKVHRVFNPNIHIMGLLLTNVDDRTNAAKKIESLSEECCKILETKRFETIIYHSTVVNDAQPLKQSLREYRASSKVAKSYTSFAKEVVGDLHER